MTDQKPPGQESFPPSGYSSDLPLVTAEELGVKRVATYYEQQKQGKNAQWTRTYEAWESLETWTADPASLIDEPMVQEQFDEALYNDGVPQNPASDVYRFNAVGRASLPLFAARRALRDPTTLERVKSYGLLGDEMEYVIDYRGETDFGTLSEFITLGVYLRPGSPSLLIPSSPREAMGHGTDKNHDAYDWSPVAEKIPVEVKHLKRKSPGIHPSISVVRIGHKIQEAIAGQALDLRSHDRRQVEQDTLYVAQLMIQESRGSDEISLDNRELLDRFSALVYDKVDDDQLVTRPSDQE